MEVEVDLWGGTDVLVSRAVGVAEEGELRSRCLRK